MTKATTMRTTWAKAPQPAQSAPPALTASDIIHKIGRSRRPGTTPKGYVAGAWTGAGVLGGSLCWWVVADHFALSRQADAYVSLAISRWASHNEVINHAVYVASQTDILTGALMVALLYYCWFRNDAAESRARLLLGFGAALVSGVASRLLQVSLPLRLRPMHAGDSGFQPLPGIDPELASHWGSFPSDHAALFFALVAVVWRQSRTLGPLATLSALFGVLPRVYLGLHYLSDVVAGATLGVALVFMAGRFGPRRLAGRVMAWGERHPGLACGTAFLLCFEVATLFEDIRQVGRGVPAVLKQLGL